MLVKVFLFDLPAESISNHSTRDATQHATYGENRNCYRPDKIQCIRSQDVVSSRLVQPLDKILDHLEEDNRTLHNIQKKLIKILFYTCQS